MKCNLINIIIYAFIPFLIYSCSGGHKLSSYNKPGAKISKSDQIAVVPVNMGLEDSVVLPDAISTELVGFGFNVIDRSALTQRARDKGLDLSIIINEAEYYKLGYSTNVNQLVIVNSQLHQNTLVKNATVKVINAKDGSIIFSSTFQNPAPTSPAYIRNLDMIEIAKLFAELLNNASN